VRLWVEALVGVPPVVQVTRRYQLIGPQLEVGLLEVVELSLFMTIYSRNISSFTQKYTVLFTGPSFPSSFSSSFHVST
jgi:hypothetical protein